MGKESLHISPIHLSLSPLWSHGETRSGPLTFLGRTDGRTDGQRGRRGYLSWELGRATAIAAAVDGTTQRHNSPLRLPRSLGPGYRRKEGTGAATTTSIVLLQKGQCSGGICTGRLIIPQSIAKLAHSSSFP